MKGKAEAIRIYTLLGDAAAAQSEQFAQLRGSTLLITNKSALEKLIGA